MSFYSPCFSLFVYSQELKMSLAIVKGALYDMACFRVLRILHSQAPCDISTPIRPLRDEIVIAQHRNHEDLERRSSDHGTEA